MFVSIKSLKRMKQLPLVTACLLAACIMNAQDKKELTKAPVVKTVVTNPKAGKFQFKEEKHDFGEIMEGTEAECDFEFTNVGKEAILIKEAKGNCGCTIPDWPKNPIPPGKTDRIHVIYRGKVGEINKDIIVTSNAQQSSMVLHLTGNVKAKPSDRTDTPALPPEEH
jgi:hypothetical protein